MSPKIADTAYRSKANEEFLLDHGKVSRIHRKKPKGRSMSKATARANAVKSKIRARVEHVFAEQKDRMGLFIRTIGKARAQGRVSRIHRKKPKGKPMPERTAKANAVKSKVRARVEHVFAQQKDTMGLFVRTIGIKRAQAKIMLANLAYNMNRLIFHERRVATA